MTVKKNYFCCFCYFICLEGNRVKAGAAGGIEAVVKAINTHIDYAGVCQHGCGALWSMTLNGKKLIKCKTN